MPREKQKMSKNLTFALTKGRSMYSNIQVMRDLNNYLFVCILIYHALWYCGSGSARIITTLVVSILTQTSLNPPLVMSCDGWRLTRKSLAKTYIIGIVFSKLLGIIKKKLNSLLSKKVNKKLFKKNFNFFMKR